MSIRTEGRLKSWHDERGFGFIEPIHGGQEIFVHAKAFRGIPGRPKVGQFVSFEIELNPQGKKRAANVERIETSRVATRRASGGRGDWGTATLLAIPAFALVYAVVAVLWRVPNPVAGAYVILSVACFVAYALDKSAAHSGRWRTRESTLLALGMLGGWPGALLAQQLLRHKSVKAGFRQAFWGSVVVNVGAFVILSSPLVNAWVRLRV